MTAARPRILHLVGSPTNAFFCDLSRLYARGCLQATAGVQEPVITYVTPDRRWRFPADLGDAAIGAAEALEVGEAIGHLEGLGVDAMLPQMFCRAGMTDYRALFEVLDIPYVGNRPATMALGADKPRAKAVVSAAGVATPRAEIVADGDPVTLAPPVVVKPVDSDNSAGVTLVRERAALGAAVREACRHSARALVEEYVELGREVRCGLVERDGELLCLPLEEYAVDAARKPIRELADKLARDRDGDLGLVAKQLSRAWLVDEGDPLCPAVWDTARTCHAALGCRHHSLFDFRIDPDGRPWFIEAGLYCSYAPQSVICTMARGRGLSASALLQSAVRTAAREPTVPSPRSA